MEEKLKLLKKALGRSYSNGTEYLFSCPKCEHHKLKLSVNIEKDVFKCWVCDYSGNKIKHLFRSYAYSHYGEWCSLTGIVDISKYEDLFTERVAEKEEIRLPEHFKTLTGPYSKLKKRPLDYLKSRGFSEKDILRWKIGYCDYGPFAKRIIIPSFNKEGELDYFIARSYSEDSYKYKNPQASKDVVFNDLNINWNDDIMLVEGVFDAVKSPNAIPLLGSTLREGSKLFQKISVLRPRVYLALDRDAKEKELFIAQKLKRHDIEVFCLDIGPFNDVGEMSKEEIKKRKLKAVFVSDTDYLEYKLNF